MISVDEHNRLRELHELMRVNGVHNMKQIELDEFSHLMAKSLQGLTMPAEELSTTTV